MNSVVARMFYILGRVGGGGLVSGSGGSLVGGGVVLGVLGLTLVLDISDISVLWKDREG